MKILTHPQVNELFQYYFSQYTAMEEIDEALKDVYNKDNVIEEDGRFYIPPQDTWILNITLTLEQENRRILKQQENGILRSYHRFLIKLANATNSHIFGWIGTEDDMVREHSHILALMKWDRLKRPSNPLKFKETIAKLWNNGRTDVKLWDGKPNALFYNYSHSSKYSKLGKVWDKEAHYHYVLPTTVYHPRRAKCKKGVCDVCKSFPSPSYFGVEI